MSARPWSSLHLIHARRLKNNPRVVPHFEQPPNRFTAVVSVVESTFVDVHTNELIGELGIEIAGKLHGVAERFFAMIDCVLDALAQRLFYTGHRFRPERTADWVFAQRA